MRFILRGLDGEELEWIFRRHAADLSGSAAREAGAPACVAKDGKTSRGSFDAFNDRKAAHVRRAFTHDGQTILGQLAAEGKSIEIPAAQEMIATLGITGRLFLLDAMHSQKNLRPGSGHGQSSAGPAQG